MKAQAAAAGDDMSAMGGMASNLEINPKHEVVLKLKGMVGDDAAAAAASPTAKAYAELLYDVAAVSSGYEISDPAAFAKRVVALMSGGDDALAALATDEELAAPADGGLDIDAAVDAAVEEAAKKADAAKEAAAAKKADGDEDTPRDVEVV